jgi:MFS family permease
MKKRLLSIPQLMFVVSTRAALGAGVALLASGRLSDRKRRRAGLTLALVGAATTIPALRIVEAAKPSLMRRVAQRLHR